MLDNEKESKSPQIPSESSAYIDGEVNSTFEPTQFDGPTNFASLAWKDKLLYILDWANDNYENHGLTTNQIVEIFNKKCKQPYIDSTKIRKEITRRLINSTYIRYTKEGRNNTWYISPQGKDYIQKFDVNKINPKPNTSGKSKIRKKSSEKTVKKFINEDTLSSLKDVPIDLIQDYKQNIENIDNKGKVLISLILANQAEGLDGITTSEINKCLLDIFRISPLNAGTLSNIVKNLEKENLVHSKTISSGKRPVRKYILLDKGIRELTEKLNKI